MTRLRWPAGLFVLTAFALGGISDVTATARADDGLTGVYSVAADNGERSTWTIESSCTPSCVARVRSSAGWNGYAQLANGRWTMAVYLAHWLKSSYAPDPASCVASSGGVPVSQSWSWDASTLTGTVETVHSDQCGGPVTSVSAPFHLLQNSFEG